MNKLEKVNRLSPSGLYADCAKFTIDNIEESFVLHGVTEAGKEYAFSAWFIGSSLVINGKAMPETEDWTQCKFTFLASGKDVPINFLSPGVYYLFNSKLESGNKFTDWMPAPEDAEAEISNITEITTTHTTQISTMQGQITALIAEDTIIKGDYDALVSRYNATVAEVDSIKTTIGEHTTLIDANTQDILAVSTKAATIETDLNGIKTRVIANETAIEKKADGTEVESLTKRVTASETAIEQNAAKIELRATKTEVGALDSRLEAAEASIIVHTKDIALTVKESDVTGDYLVAKINLSSTSATIEAKHINLIGAVTAECIATKAVKAQNIDIEDLFAQKITATNMTIKGTSTFEGNVYAKYLEAQAVNVGGDFKVRWNYFDATAFGIGMSGNADGTALGHIELYSDAVNEYGCIVNFGLQLNEKVYAAKEIECANNIKATDFKTGEGISLTDMYEKMKPDYVKAYRSGSNITCSKSFSIIPLSVQAKYGDTFEFLSDGTIKIKKACHLDVSAQVYFTTGFTSGDWIAIAICCNGNVNVRTGQYVDRANPYLMLAVSTKISMSAGETISLVAMNETGDRGTINTGVSDTFLHANVIAYT